MNPAELLALADHGIVIPPSSIYSDDPVAHQKVMAFDAQPQLSTTSPNAGVPWMLTNIVSPKAIRVLVTPMKSVKIMGGNEEKVGNWTTLTAQFPIVESTGQVTSYGDYNNDGNSGVNPNWVPRQSYHYQTMLRYGEREQEMFGLTGLNYVDELNFSSALVMAKFANQVNFFGIAGLQNYGLLNDPSLPAYLTPSTKAAGGTAWMTTGGVPNGTANEVFADIQTMFAQLQVQTKGYVDTETRLVLAMSPQTEVAMLTTNVYKVQVKDLVKTAFPNIRIENAPEYATQGGNVVQMFVEEIDGDRVAYPAFTEKLRNHPVIPDVSSFKQKRSAGTWGTIIKRPVAFVQMIGV